MAEEVVTLAGQPTGIRYGWHDRYRIPLDHPSALPFYLKNLLVPHSRREFLWACVARASSWAGRYALPVLGRPAARELRGEVPRNAAAHASGDTAEKGSAIIDSLAGVLTRRLREAGVAFEGPPSFITLDDYRHSGRQKMVVFIFDRSAAEPRAVAKVSFNPEHATSLRHEYEAVRGLRERLGPELRDTVTRPLALIEERGLTVFVESFMRGRSMYVEVRNSWLPRRRAEEHFRLARRWLVQFHKATRAGEATGLGEHVTGPLKEYARLCKPAPAVRRLFDAAAQTARKLKGARLPLAARQGDFWARNLIVSGGAVGVVDWEGYRERGAPFHDMFLFATSYGLSFPWRLGRWAEPAVALRATFLAETWLCRLVRRHLRDYCQAVGASPAMLKVFFPVFLAEQALGEVRRSTLREKTTHGRGGRGGAGEIAPGAWGRLLEEYARSGGSPCFETGAEDDANAV